MVRWYHGIAAGKLRRVTSLRIAVIISAYNRRERTLDCLRALRRQETPQGTSIDVFLTDDASSDGTGDAIRAAFPEVTVLNGTGSLFWGGGMRLAFGEAMKGDFDAYLWSNDDTELVPDCLARLVRLMVERRAQGESKLIVVGATHDPNTGVLTYSGAVHSSRYHPLKFRPVVPGDVPLRCDTFNGNCVLISRDAAGVVGNISPGFTQGMGDFDYGLRAQQAGCSIWLASGFVGACARNPKTGSWEDPSLPARKRWQVVCGPKGLPPGEYMRYAVRHAGILWPVYWTMPYARLLISSVLKRRSSMANSDWVSSAATKPLSRCKR